MIIGTVHQPHFLPWLGYFNKLLNSKVFIVLDDVQFRRRYFQNRTDILSPNAKKMRFTVPVKKHNRNDLINTIQICYDFNWVDKLLKTIEHSYGKTNYFEKVFMLLKNAIRESNDGKLISLNMNLIKGILNYLGHNLEIVYSSKFRSSSEPTFKLIELCLQNDVEAYIFGEGNGMNYHNLELFKNSGIKYYKQDFFQNYPVYHQNSATFIKGLSVIDLLFNVEPCEAKSIILTPWSIT